MAAGWTKGGAVRAPARPQSAGAACGESPAAPRQGDDAEGAAVLAAVLDLDEIPGASPEMGDGGHGDIHGLPDIPYPDEGRRALRQGIGQTRQLVLLLVADDQVHAGDARHC